MTILLRRELCYTVGRFYPELYLAGVLGTRSEPPDVRAIEEPGST